MRECILDTISLMDKSSVVIENCENLDVSKIKVSDSEFSIKDSQWMETDLLDMHSEQRFDNHFLSAHDFAFVIPHL